MKRIMLIAATALLVAACAPVLSKDLMREGSREVPFDRLRADPGAHKGRLYILGGVIVDTHLTEEGSQIEAMFVPVDSTGDLKEIVQGQGRFLAVYPKSRGLLDPVVYKKGREITVAGEFVETRTGKIDEMQYVYPVFEIREIYLWPEYHYYYDPYFYPYYPYPPYYYDRWGRPYPYWPPPW